jgi:hypothetical protein
MTVLGASPERGLEMLAPPKTAGARSQADLTRVVQPFVELG